MITLISFFIVNFYTIIKTDINYLALQIYNIIDKSSNNDNLISINVGILQALIGFGSIVIAILTFINFKATSDKLEKIQTVINEHENKLKNNFSNSDQVQDKPEKFTKISGGGLINDL